MSLSDLPGSHRLSDEVSGNTFLSRFDWKIRQQNRISHPKTGEMYLPEHMISQAFRRSFGEVIQFAFTSGLRKKIRLCLAAIKLEQAPREDALREIAGPEGFDFQEETFYCLGVYSPEPWSLQWKQHAEVRGNSMIYLVEKGDGTSWRVFGTPGPLQNIFNPESEAEALARAKEDLASSSNLIIPGDQIAVDAFVLEHSLDRRSVEQAAADSLGKYRIIEHKGKSYIQRSIVQEESCR